MRTWFAVAAVAVAVIAPASAAAAVPAEAPLTAVSGEVVADSYIAVLASGARDAGATALAARHGVAVSRTYSGGLKGFSFHGSALAARRLAADPAIAYVQPNALKPAVANMSLGGGANTALDDAVRASIASGVTYAIAAGNGFLGLFALDACTQSPARVTQAITVSATNAGDAKPSWANRGTCVDVFAPGVNITSAWNTSPTATNTISGTSMATPHVVGAAALYLQNHPLATPAEVQSAIVAAATTGVVTSPGSGSPNRLLYTGSF